MNYKKHTRYITKETLKLLLARSGNQCAFPECSHPIFDDNNLFVSQLCHIEAVSPLGQRHNPDKSNEEINSYDNLLFLCYRHHKQTDLIDLFPVVKMMEIKKSHEAKFMELTYEFSNAILDNLIKDIDVFWKHIEIEHTKHIVPELAVPIDINAEILDLLSDVKNNIKSLNEINELLINECGSNHFETLCLGFPNLLTRINVSIDQIEIKHIEDLILKNPKAKELVLKLKNLRVKFSETVKSVGLID